MAAQAGEKGMTAREVCERISKASFEELPALLDTLGADPRKQVASAVARARRRLAKELAERERVGQMYALMRELGGDGIVLGVDEVGRGPVAGPLTVAAVALPAEPIVWGLNDSKKLSSERREELAARIAEVAIAIGIAHIEPATIDALGMAICLRRAMSLAIADAGVEPDAVLIDGNPVHVHPKETCIVKGDGHVACIAAASIVAKVTRDAMMVAYDRQYPGYHLAECKGYGSAAHIAAIKERGLTPIHRATFCENFVEKKNPV